MSERKIRSDHKIIMDLVKPNSTVLDLGCGDGELLSILRDKKNTRGQGTDIQEEAIYKCVERGLNVFHSDIDSGLSDYPDNSFDYVIMNQSLQETRNIKNAIFESLRVGRVAIIGFPNFAYIRSRFQLFFKGIAPVTASLPYAWYDSPNAHFLTIKDFMGFCRKRGIRIIQAYFLWRGRQIFFCPNLFAHIAIFVLSKDNS